MYNIKDREEIKIIIDKQIQLVYFGEIGYPYYLSQICDRPQKIYVLGNKEILREKCISIVGSRECSKYGADMAQKIAYNLAKKNIVLVSGLARGIDTNAHIGTLKAGGRTIAVLANGLDTIYPKENIKLAKEIIKSGGAIISEYPIGEKPLSTNFPKRNRIISGLSNSTIVIEAKRRSGSLITAYYAIEQGRKLYCVPGNVSSRNSEGTNRLIKNGAQILTSSSLLHI